MLRQKLQQRMAADLLKTQTSLWGHQKKMYWKTFHGSFTTSLEITCRLWQSLFFLSPHPGPRSAVTDVTSDSKELSASFSAVKDGKKIGLMSRNQPATTSQRTHRLAFLSRFDHVQTIADVCAISSLNLNIAMTFSTVFFSWAFQGEQGKCAAFTIGGKSPRCPLGAKMTDYSLNLTWLQLLMIATSVANIISQKCRTHEPVWLYN